MANCSGLNIYSFPFSFIFSRFNIKTSPFNPFFLNKKNFLGQSRSTKKSLKLAKKSGIKASKKENKIEKKKEINKYKFI